MKKNEFKVEAESVDLRLDHFLQNKTSLSRSKIQKDIEKKQILVNSNLVKASYKIKLNDLISYSISEDKKIEIKEEKISIPVVYEDDHIIVVNKPAGVVTHPGAGNESGTLVNAFLSKLAKTQDNTRPGVVHRLDKDTQGLLVMAKTQKSLEKLALQFKEKTAKRTYWALCHGRFKNLSGSLQSMLARHPKNRKKFSSQDSGKLAITHYKVLKSGLISHLELDLETGRTHQIRVHLSEMGHPVLNDPIYGSEKRKNEIKNTAHKAQVKRIQELGLVAKKLSFLHPQTNEKVSFEIQWPEVFDLPNEIYD